MASIIFLHEENEHHEENKQQLSNYKDFQARKHCSTYFAKKNFPKLDVKKYPSNLHDTLTLSY